MGKPLDRSLPLRQRRALRETSYKGGVVTGGSGKYIARNGRGKGRPRDGEGIHLGGVERKTLQFLLWKKIAEVSDTAANHGLRITERRPGKAETRFKCQSGGGIKSLRNAGLYRLIIWNRGIVIGQLEWHGKPGKRISRAGDIGLTVPAQCAGELQVRGDRPIILDVETEIVGGKGRMQSIREGLVKVAHLT